MRMKGKRMIGFLLLGMILLLSACAQRPAAEMTPSAFGIALTESPVPSPIGSIQTEGLGERGWKNMEREELEQLFAEWGFSEEEPFYQRRTPEGELDLTLYLDEEGERGIGFWGSLEDDMDRRDGFAFEGFSSPEGWGDWYGWRDPYALPAVERNDVILDCWEEWEYNNYGRRAEGCVYAKVDDPRFGDPDRVPLYEAKYTYNVETRKLEHREIWTNYSPCLSLSYEPHDSWYDERGRLAYEEKYITHGNQNYYYIYREGSMAPAYCLYVDLADSPVNYLALIRYPEPLVPQPLPEGSPLTLAGEELDFALMMDVPSDEYSFSQGAAANLEGWFQLLGFQAEEPFYEYHDPDGILRLRLWYDEESGMGVGIRYRDYGDPLETLLYGFGFTTTGWAERDPEREKEGFGWYRWEEPLALPLLPDHIMEDWKYWEREEYDEEGRLIGRASYTDCSDQGYPEDTAVY